MRNHVLNGSFGAFSKQIQHVIMNSFKHFSEPKMNTRRNSSIVVLFIQNRFFWTVSSAWLTLGMWWSCGVIKVKGQRYLKWVSAPNWRPSKLEMWNVSFNINTYGTVWINLSPKWDYLKWQKSLELDKIFLWKLFNLLSISKNSQIHRQCHEDNTWLTQPTRRSIVQVTADEATWSPGLESRSWTSRACQLDKKGALVQAADFI